MATTTPRVARTQRPEPIVCTGRPCHHAVIFRDEDLEPEAARCQCGATWNELNDPPATEWVQTHVAPTPTIVSAFIRRELGGVA